MSWASGIEAPPKWQERGLCSQTDPEAFFPEKGGSTREAKRVCSRCEVKAECLDYALGHDERFGIWGGLSERERRKLKRQQGGSPRKLPAVAVRIKALAAAGKGDPEIGANLSLSPGAVFKYRNRYGIAPGRPAGTGNGPLIEAVRKKVKGKPWQEFELRPRVDGEVR